MDRWLAPSVETIERLVPELTVQQIVDEIDSIAQNPGAARIGWLQTHWLMMSPTQRLAWVERRRAPLLIIWVRGGPEGFYGLRDRFRDALEEIDR
ncbi:hypothetical protein [uncultured Tateyamaria sp.]|uniref:hypothetical protein n=1 Tax=uncultured Tateyamaria sp. TaxID=455651 RepID=UPI00262183B4|nr:hypothetical protein [uncultured Tateyamaria sp.]